MRQSLMIFALLFAGSACDHNELVGCTNNTQCPEGHICDAGRCEKVCAADDECSRGTICVDSICQPGLRNAPTISGVIGNGTTSCTDSPDNRCFADAIVVQGDNLLGASFRLDNQAAGPSFTGLTLGSQQDNDQVEVNLPLDLAEGSYALVAHNAAGEDQTDVQILQGEPGPAGSDLTGQQMLTTINTGATGMFVVSRLPTSDDVITHINNGTIKIDPDLLPPEGGTSYDSNDIVGLVNGATINIYSERLGRDANDVITRINGGSTAIGVHLLPAANELITYLNTGTEVLGTHVAPGGGGGGTMTGDEIITAINSQGTTLLDSARLDVGTGSAQVARGDHTHPSGGHVHDASDITTGTMNIGRLPTGTTSTTVSRGDHTHPGGGSSRLVISNVAPGAGVAITRAQINPLCQDEDGCSIRMGYNGFTYASSVEPAGILWGRDCPVHITGDAWLTSYFCDQSFDVYSGSSFQPYNTDIYGTDGDSDSTYPQVLAYSSGGQWVCNLTESTSSDTNDNTVGFYFWTQAAAVPNFFDVAGRACHLIIED